jgi:uncharacterized protein YprB with RNaseH-like and TPR domain
MNDAEPRCIHRHSIKTHPNCFRRGLIEDPLWWEGKTIGYFDIEVGGSLHADRGLMLAWCIKYKDDENIRSDIINKKELFDYTFDKRIVTSAVKELENIDVLVTYYGKGFDLPYLRSKALFYGIDFPNYGTMFHWDLYYHCKRHFKLGRYSLDNITNYLGISGKTHLDWGMWQLAQYGEPKALEEVLYHCEQDVEILEKLHERIGNFSKWIKTSI